MIRRILGWLLALTAVGIVAAAVLPIDLEPADALLPIGLPVAVAAILVGGRSVASAVALLALVAGGAVVGREVAGGDTAPGQGPLMVVVTHNVGRTNVDPRGTIAALAASGADVLMLQETDGTVAGYLPALRQRYPYGNPCRRPCSMAILSRWPLARVRWRFHDAAGDAYGPALYTTVVRLPWGGQATLATVHLSRADPAAARADRRAELAAAIREASPASLVLAGDFNLTPWGAAMRRLDAGLRPMRRATRAAFSFPARWAGRAVAVPLVPIDHVYAGPDWRVTSVQRLHKTGSDHYPIRVNLLWQRRQI